MAPKVDYIFTRDYLDNNRINLMHSLWTKVFGYVIHPKIPTKLDGLRVADVGTGTGIWLFDVRDQVAKSAQFVGLDISFDAAPHPKTIPSNITFQHWNVKEDLPEEYIAAFDIVHVRFLSFVLLNEEVQGVTEKLFRMLKPGGYLQWGEPDMETVRIEKADPEVKTERLEELFKLLEIQDPRLKPTWAADLHNIFSAAGFVDVEVENIDPPPHWAYVFHEGGLMMHEIISRKTKSERMQQEVQRLLPQAVEETRNGAWGNSARLTVIGKKPEH
ncbi:Demethylmenaquinone methyltransferase [Cytospora mali]|uniref:Demethylmenaquinone methyltransferase n=1 Tax=Cytospora mali TaxID=578113 RepID=A0A194V4V4_CYTMA|nr:Demethylmenaquinone methyltransferase [Valsa mali var. pyri (nom. inval.)]